MRDREAVDGDKYDVIALFLPSCTYTYRTNASASTRRAQVKFNRFTPTLRKIGYTAGCFSRSKTALCKTLRLPVYARDTLAGGGDRLVCS